jgi:hypothetical protein
VNPPEAEMRGAGYDCLEQEQTFVGLQYMPEGDPSMNKYRSDAASLLRRGNPDESVVRECTDVAPGHTRHAFSVPLFKRLRATQAHQTPGSISWNQSCKNSFSRVQYNIDVVKRILKLQVSDAV